MQRVPVGRTAGRTMVLSDPQQYPVLAEMMEAWAARLMFAQRTPMSRAQAAIRWYEEEFSPATSLIQEGNLTAKGETPADAYLRLSRA